MESNFEKPKEVFVKNKTYNKTLFQFIHMCHDLGYVTIYLQLIFTDLNF